MVYGFLSPDNAKKVRYVFCETMSSVMNIFGLL